MNTVVLMGRLTRDPEVRYSAGENSSAFARYSIAVDRRFKREGQPEADFFDCVSFGRQAEFVDKYLRKGTKIVLQGRIENNNYTNREGQKVYGIRIVSENIEFAESKAASDRNASGYSAPQRSAAPAPSAAPARSRDVTAGIDKPDTSPDGFMNIPDGIEEDLPFV